MKKILVATHGNFAEGIISSINLILGEQDNLHYMNAYLDEVPLKEKNKNIFLSRMLPQKMLLSFLQIYLAAV